MPESFGQGSMVHTLNIFDMFNYFSSLSQQSNKHSCPKAVCEKVPHWPLKMYVDNPVKSHGWRSSGTPHGWVS